MKRRYSKTLRGEIKTELNKLKHGIVMWLIVCAVCGAFYVADGYFGWNLLPHTAVTRENVRAVDTEGASVAVHFIDVGQGDSELIVTADKSMLIDSGEEQYADSVIKFLHNQNITKLNYIIATHPHSDHIGGMSKIIADFPPDTVIMPKIQDSVVPTTAVYERMLTAIAANPEIEVAAATPGLDFDMGGGAVVRVIAPVRDYDDLNDYSVTAKLTFGSDSFLFTGDIEKTAESDIADGKYGTELRADVLKVPHHGANTSSTAAFLGLIMPKYAVIEVGAGNAYGHPTRGVLDRLAKVNATVLRTDELGSITFLCGGNGEYKILHSRE